MTEGLPTEPRPASQEDIEDAIQALTPAQLVHLEKIAWFRHRALGPRGAGRHEGDILSDAIIAVLEGRRKWVKNSCDFMTFLKGVMRSLTSHIRDGRAIDAFDEIAPTPVNEQGNAAGVLERVPTQDSVDPDRQLRECDLDKQIRERFADDTVVLLVYEAFLENMKPADIRSCLGITDNEYHAAAKRLRRTVRAVVEGRSR